MLNCRFVQCFEEPKHCVRARTITLELPRHSPKQKKNKPPEPEKARERNAQVLLLHPWQGIFLMRATLSQSTSSEAAGISEITAMDLQNLCSYSCCFVFWFCIECNSLEVSGG